jgi:predicted XRE-type DNA-binding protein
VQAARLIGLAQPDLSNILRGRFRGYSAERLMRCLSNLDGDIEIRQRGKTLATISA